MTEEQIVRLVLEKSAQIAQGGASMETFAQLGALMVMSIIFAVGGWFRYKGNKDDRLVANAILSKLGSIDRHITEGNKNLLPSQIMRVFRGVMILAERSLYHDIRKLQSRTELLQDLPKLKRAHDSIWSGVWAEMHEGAKDLWCDNRALGEYVESLKVTFLEERDFVYQNLLAAMQKQPHELDDLKDRLRMVKNEILAGCDGWVQTGALYAEKRPLDDE